MLDDNFWAWRHQQFQRRAEPKYRTRRHRLEEMARKVAHDYVAQGVFTGQEAERWLRSKGYEPTDEDRTKWWYLCDGWQGGVAPTVVALPLNDDDRITRFDTSDGMLKVWTRDWRCFVVHDDHTYSEVA